MWWLSFGHQSPRRSVTSSNSCLLLAPGRLLERGERVAPEAVQVRAHAGHPVGIYPVESRASAG